MQRKRGVKERLKGSRARCLPDAGDELAAVGVKPGSFLGELGHFRLAGFIDGYGVGVHDATSNDPLPDYVRA